MPDEEARKVIDRVPGEGATVDPLRAGVPVRP